jgi:NTP pyrophosphatase (non-canonical NTP hydrolase)
MSTLMNYAEESYDIAKKNGLWDSGEKRNKGEMVMLMVSELGECLEAHRKGRICKMPGEYSFWMDVDPSRFEWQNMFKTHVKDTVEDEMADIVLWILSYVHGFDIKVIPRDYRKESTGNFGHDLLRINWYIINAMHESEQTAGRKALNEFFSPNTPTKDWGYVLASIEAFCAWYSIDIHKHVQWKMKYNSTREKLHGKAY